LKKKRKIYKDKRGREFIKQKYFVGGKMKFYRVYVIDGIPVDEFYEKNATDLDFFINGDYHLMNHEIESNTKDTTENHRDSEKSDTEDLNDLPF